MQLEFMDKSVSVQTDPSIVINVKDDSDVETINDIVQKNVLNASEARNYGSAGGTHLVLNTYDLTLMT